MRAAICEAVVAAAENGARPSAVEVGLPMGDGDTELRLRFEAAQLPAPAQCVDVVPRAARFAGVAAPVAASPAPAIAAAPRDSCADAPPSVATPVPCEEPAAAAPSPSAAPNTPYIPSYPSRSKDPLDFRR